MKAKHVITTFVFATAMVFGAATTIAANHNVKMASAEADLTVYLELSDQWAGKLEYGGSPHVHYWGGSSATDWPGTEMTLVSGKIYTANIEADSTGLIFNMNDSVGSWNGDTQTENLALVEGKDLFTVTSSNVGSKQTGEWSKYVAPVPDIPDEDGYYLVGTKTNWKFEGATKLAAGDEKNLAKLIGYEVEKGEEFKVRSYIEGVETWYGVGEHNENYVAIYTTTLNIYLRTDDQHVYVVDTDVPAKAGYYVLGTATEWKFASAPEMVEGLDADGNIAHLYGFTAAVDQKIKVRHFHDGVKTWSFGGTTEVDYGHLDEDGNFVFTTAGFYDIFAKWEGEPSELKFYVAPAATRYTVSYTNVLFSGKVSTGTEANGSVVVVEGDEFTPDPAAKEGYRKMGIFTDAACTVAYEGAAITADTTLYVKQMKIAYYVVGDATYTGSEATAWKVEGGSIMVVPENDNRLEGTIVIPASASASNKVAVKPLLFQEDGTFKPESYDLGAVYDFATLDGGNIVFSRGGTYAVYVNGSNIYFTSGAQAFYDNFINRVKDVCDSDGKTTNIALLQSVWGDLKAEYNELDAETEQKTIKDKGFDGGKEDGDSLERMIAKYHYIVTKYGTETFEDFIWGQTIVVEGATSVTVDNTANSTVLVIILVSAASLLFAASFVMIKRRRTNK